MAFSAVLAGWSALLIAMQSGAADAPAPGTPQPAGAQQAAGASEAGTAPATGAQAHFDVHEYRVLGNTTLSNRDIEHVLYPLLGDHKTLADVEVARAALEKAYHDRGYATVFVDIPEQSVDDQIVRLKVTEGRLHEVRISGARYFSEGKILAQVPEAKIGTVPNIQRLQEQLAAVNVQTPDRNVVPVLKAGPEPGTVDLAMKVDDHLPVHGSVQVDNQNTPFSKQLRLTGSLSYANLFDRLDDLSVQYQLSPQDTAQVRVIAANYAFGAVGPGLQPSLGFVDSDSNVPVVSTLGVLGKGQVYSARLGIPLTGQITSPQTMSFGADYKHFLQAVTTAQSTGGAGTALTPVSYTNLSISYAGSWGPDWLRGSLSDSANFGPRGVPNNPAVFANKRFKGEPNYFYFKWDGALVLTMPVGFELLLRFDGQLAVEPLINNEDFSITGANAVRGYLEAESLTDNGLVGSAQFDSPKWIIKGIPVADVFVFFDEGHAHVIEPLIGEPGSLTLRSAGAGFELLPGKPITGTLTWAHPLVTGVDTRRDDSRLLFIVRGVF